MQNFLKRLNCWLLIIMLILNSAGYTLVYFQLKTIFKHEAQSKIKNDATKAELISLNIPLDNYEDLDDKIDWIEDNEFFYKGHYYDVASIFKNSNRITILCYKDISETILEELFKDYLSNSLNNKSSKAVSLLNLLIDYACEPPRNEINPIYTELEYLLNNIISNSETFIKIPSPPPRPFHNSCIKLFFYKRVNSK